MCKVVLLQRVTMGIRELAKLASVSTATVSRLIKRAARVSPKTATRVVRAMQALNFQPNEAARLLAFQKKLKNGKWFFQVRFSPSTQYSAR